MSKWSQLPNAAHIARILVSLKANPNIWADAWNETYNGAWNTARNAVWKSVWDTTWDTTWDPAWNAVDEAASNAASNAGKEAAHVATLALIVYDDSAKYLDMSLDQVKMWYQLTEHPAALLLQPAVLAFSMERALA